MEKKRRKRTTKGCYSPIRFAVNSAMALEYNAVFSRITKLISIKKDISRSLIINFIPMKISFCFLQQMLICV